MTNDAVFQIAAGSIVGRDHRTKMLNNQDGYCVLTGAYTVAVVTDGCSSGAHSEVGAKLGAHVVAQAVQREAVAHGESNMNWQKVNLDLMATLNLLATQMGDNYRKVVSDYFLFTVVGVLIGAETATFFAVGDGVVIVNGDVTQLGPFPENMPPYVGYGLLGGWEVEISPDAVRLAVIQQVALCDLESFLIGSDGVARAADEGSPRGLLDLTDAGAKLPGMNTEVGPIEEYWEDDAVFRNREIINRRLKLIGRDWPRQNPEPGLLADDTTIVVGRKQPMPGKQEGGE